MISDPAGAVTAAEPRPGLAILVVDDDRSSREGLRGALAHDGHRVEAAADAWQALARIRHERFRLAILDLDLPPVHGLDLGGWDLVRIARGYQPGIPLILLSAEDDPGVLREARALGVGGVLAKPIGLGQLRRLMDLVLAPDRDTRDLPP